MEKCGGKKCQKKDSGLLFEEVKARPVNECGSASEVFEKSLTCFGGGVVKDIFSILKEIMVKKIPLVITVSGPLPISDQHRGWLIPLLELGNVACVTTTDANCYHDGHDALMKTGERVIKRADLYGDDALLREKGIIRITDTGFNEDILFRQDEAISQILFLPEFQKTMTTTERNYRLGRQYAKREKAVGAKPGLLSTCYRLGIPVFIGAPADGSNFLNSVKLWKMAELTGGSHKFNIDLHADVFEFCAYHYWGLQNSDSKTLAILILGGGVPKNYSLQPEPCLSQIFGLEDIRGYDYDIQIVSAPEIEGSLTGCRPNEAVSWGKVNPETYRKKTASLQADYTTIMNFLVYALVNDKDIKKTEPFQLYKKRLRLVKNLEKAILRSEKRK